jgi:hypothetical protein
MPAKSERARILDEIMFRRRKFLESLEAYGPHYRTGRPLNIEALTVSRGSIRGLLIKNA